MAIMLFVVLNRATESSLNETVPEPNVVRASRRRQLGRLARRGHARDGGIRNADTRRIATQVLARLNSGMPIEGIRLPCPNRPYWFV